MKEQGLSLPVLNANDCLVCGKDPEDTVFGCPFLHKEECYLGWTIMAGALKTSEKFESSLESIPATCQIHNLVTGLPSWDYDVDPIEERLEDEINQDEIEELLEEVRSFRSIGRSHLS